MNKHSIIFIIIFLFFVACREKSSEIDIVVDNLPQVQLLHHESVQLPEEGKLVNPYGIEVVNDEYLIIINESSDRIIQVFQLPELNWLYSWGRLGRGPGEFYSHIDEQSINIKKDTLIFYNTITNRGSLKYYVINDEEIREVKEHQIFYEGQRMPLNRVRRITDELYFADFGIVEETNQEYIALSPNSIDSLFTFGSFPDTDLQRHRRAQYFAKTNVAKPDGQKFAAYYLHHNKFSMYDFEGNPLVHGDIHDLNVPIAQQSTNEFIYRAFTHASDDYIYVYSPYSNEETIFADPENYSPIIEIWNWDGEPITRLKLDRPVHQFTVSERYGEIFTFSVFENDQIYIYDIEEIISNL